MNEDADDDRTQRPLRLGDLVRVSELGQRTSKRLKDRNGHLGRILLVKTSTDTAAVNGSSNNNDDDDETEDEDYLRTTTNGCSTGSTDTKKRKHRDDATTATATATPTYYNVDWVLGGQSKNLLRHELIWTNAELEGMTTSSAPTSRTKRKPMDYMSETIQRDHIKQQQRKSKQQQQQQQQPVESATATATTTNSTTTTTTATQVPTTARRKTKTAATAFAKQRKLTLDHSGDHGNATVTNAVDSTTTTSTTSTATTMGKQTKQQQRRRSLKCVNAMGAKKSNTVSTTPTTTKQQQQKSRPTITKTMSGRKLIRSSSLKNPLNSNDTINIADNNDTIPVAVDTNTTINPSGTVALTATTTAESTTEQPIVPIIPTSDLYEKHRREFERMFVRCTTKIDIFHHFWSDNQSTMGIVVTPESNDVNKNDNNNINDDNNDHHVSLVSSSEINVDIVRSNDTSSPGLGNVTTSNTTTSAAVDTATATTTTPISHESAETVSILNWETIQQYMDDGRYILDRIRKEELERQQLFGDSFDDFNVKNLLSSSSPTSSHRVINPRGVHWELFRSDVFAMCDKVVELREQQQLQKIHASNTKRDNNQQKEFKSNDGDANQLDNIDDSDEIADTGQKGSVSYSVRKIKEAVQVAVDRTGRRHEAEMKFADDRYKYTRAIESYKNTEPAMQSWRKVPYPERIYERLNADVVCAGLSKVDEKIAAFELKTNLPNSFIGQSYRYDDTGQSEAWMKSVVDETGYNAMSKKSSKRRSSNASSSSTSGDDPSKAEHERMAALALSADEGVTRAQVSATMQSLLIAVQDRVMTQRNVLRQPELRSANWLAAELKKSEPSSNNGDNTNHETVLPNNEKLREESSDLLPEIIERPVWGIDCYTRRNIMCCMNTELDTDTSLLFIEKWLLPTINACPENLGHNITNAARILEGLPLDESSVAGTEGIDISDGKQTDTVSKWNESLMGRALLHKISVSGPLWLKAAANQLRCACESLGPDFFRVHPKGHGSVVLSTSLKANTLVTFYRGELYPSWRWGEKMNAIDITQARKDLKPALPDFYNMALERPQSDPRGYGLLFVDASRKAGHGSSLSHSCAPTCEVRVAACEGELCLAMTTLRVLEMGEELTFDYNAVTESLNEYRSAVCLCGYGKCRGSFLHFATADCYQQVLNRNSPIASRFSSLIKGSTKQVMSPDDEQILRSHGFVTAAFGAISVNRRADMITGIGEGLVDSLDMVPVWLRTYVADTLRYIEYERRALPISLICEHLSTSSSKTDDITELPVDVVREPTKERKHVSSFFYFLKTQSDFLHDLMKKEGFPDSLKGLQFRHALQKVASNYWSGLSDETKKHYKEQAQIDFEKRMKEGLVVPKKAAGELQSDGKKKMKDGSIEGKRKLSEGRRNKNKPEIHDILRSSNISFQDADAEGVVAMEQRIQQLTQTLNRVGRVLDRHREGTIESNRPHAFDAETMRKLVHAPVRVLGDAEVINWIWKSDDGVVLTLCREVQSSRFARPNFHESLRQVWEEYSSLLEASGDQLPRERRQLKEGLLKLRLVIHQELREMAKDLRQIRVQNSVQQSDEASNQNPAVSSDYDSEENIPPDEHESNSFGTEKKCITSSSIERSSADSFEYLREESHPWIEFYGERFVLHAAADVLLMYAYTSNFFVVQPYLPLQSTPVEVYARELGNTVSRNVIDNGLSCDPAIKKLNVKSSNGTITSNATVDTVSCSNTGNKKSDNELCAPDDIVAKVAIKYDGDYVSSQLLQWYNAGIGHTPGLPDLLGCALLPSVAGCWNSDLVRMYKKTKGDGKTKYETKVRPRLVEWLQDPYERGNPWSPDIRNAFSMDEISEKRTGSTEAFVTYGSPIIDFLVMGDESNIIDVLYELDADDKVTAKKSSDGLLTSVDKGRPAQAVSTWVQCEDPKCMKWRKIPWFVDADLLPEQFFCKDNIWNPAGNNCDLQADDWDKDDAMVGPDGKVEGSPVNKKKFEGSLPVSEESSFRIGTRFDVQRSDKNVYSIATVVKVDFSGSIKRIMFHFAKTSSDRDEWVEFGSARIAPLFTKIPKKVDDWEIKSFPVKETTNGSKTRILKKKRPKSTDFCANRGDEVEDLVEHNNPMKKQKIAKSTQITDGNTIKRARPTNRKVLADPSDENSFVVDAKFDVFREDKQRFCWAAVVAVDLDGPVMRICFRFPKTKDYHREWMDFGSPHICPYNSKVVGRERKEPKEDKDKCDTQVPSDPMEASSFYVGAQFDVYRREKKRHCRATVVELELVDSELKSINFQYKDDKKEWMLFGSRTIFPFRSKLKPREMKTPERTAEEAAAINTIFERNSDVPPPNEHKRIEIESDMNKLTEIDLLGQRTVNWKLEEEVDTEATKSTTRMKQRADPTNEKDFVPGVSFDVYREDKRRHCWAVVEEVDFTEHSKRVYFRFKKSKDKHGEWIDFGSSRICTYRSKSFKKEPKGKESELSVAAAAITSMVLNDNAKTSVDYGGDGVESSRYNSEVVPNLAGGCNNFNTNGLVSYDTKAHDDGSSKPQAMTVSSNMLDGTRLGNSNMNGSYDPHYHESSVVSQSAPVLRPPDFVAPTDASSFVFDNSYVQQQQQQQQQSDHHNNVPPSHGFAAAAATSQQSPSVSTFRNGGGISKGWSGLDMLAAVTFDAATTTNMDPTPSTFSSSIANAGTGQSSFDGWSGDINNNNNNNMNRSHEAAWQNHQQVPMWLQQQQEQRQLGDPRQQWHHLFDSRIVPQQAPSLQTNMYDHRDMGMNPMVTNRGFLSLEQQQQQLQHQQLQQQQQQQQQQRQTFNGNNNNMNQANQYYTRYE